MHKIVLICICTLSLLFSETIDKTYIEGSDEAIFNEVVNVDPLVVLLDGPIPKPTITEGLDADNFMIDTVMIDSLTYEYFLLFTSAPYVDTPRDFNADNIYEVQITTSVGEIIDYSIHVKKEVVNIMPIISYLLSDTTVSPTLKKTGQTTSYTPYDDGDYQKGVTPHYTRDDATEVVTDHITGLEWADDASVASVTKPWVTQANYDDGNYTDTSGDTATTYCATLALDGGGWRLPTRKELVGLVDYGRYNPALDPLFENVASSYYWSSTSYANGSNVAWRVSFGSGVQGYYYKYTSLYVRCVRAGE